MKIHTVYTKSNLRNFFYFLEGENSKFYVVDPFSFEHANQFLEDRQGDLVAIINTHEHYDHVGGNVGLKKKYDCDVLVHEDSRFFIPAATSGLADGERINWGGDELEVVYTPGHTKHHLCLIHKVDGIDRGIFSGDTIFNAGVGNCYNGGDPEKLFETIQNLIGRLSDNVKIYPGHDYLYNNLGFTLSIENGNSYAKNILELIDLKKLDTTRHISVISEEKKINCFMRLDSSEIKLSLNLQQSSQKEVFLKLRSLRNKW